MCISFASREGMDGWEVVRGDVSSNPVVDSIIFAHVFTQFILSKVV